MLAERCIQELLYNPLGYYRPMREGLTHVGPQARAVMNSRLIEHLKLPPYQAPRFDQQALTWRLARAWGDVPVIAYLVASNKWRDQLVTHPVYWHQPALVRTFMCLDFPTTRERPCIDSITAEGLTGWGGAYLSDALEAADLLPAWMTSRFRLHFSDLSTNLPLSSDDPMDTTCLWSAISYASSDPRLRSQLRC